jgi:hypothetical protein
MEPRFASCQHRTLTTQCTMCSNVRLNSDTDLRHNSCTYDRLSLSTQCILFQLRRSSCMSYKSCWCVSLNFGTAHYCMRHMCPRLDTCRNRMFDSRRLLTDLIIGRRGSIPSELTGTSTFLIGVPTLFQSTRKFCLRQRLSLMFIVLSAFDGNYFME